MAAQKIIGYDPSSMNWAEIEHNTEDEAPMSTENECLQALVRLRQRKQQANGASKGNAGAAPLASNAGNSLSAGNTGGVRAAPPPRTKTASNWRPKQTPRLRTNDLIVVLKPRGTLDLKMAFRHGDIGSAVAQYVGEVVAGDLNVWPVWDQNVIVCGTQKRRWHISSSMTLICKWGIGRTPSEDT